MRKCRYCRWWRPLIVIKEGLEVGYCTNELVTWCYLLMLANRPGCKRWEG